MQLVRAAPAEEFDEGGAGVAAAEGIVRVAEDEDAGADAIRYGARVGGFVEGDAGGGELVGRGEGDVDGFHSGRKGWSGLLACWK